MELAVKLSNVT